MKFRIVPLDREAAHHLLMNGVQNLIYCHARDRKVVVTGITSPRSDRPNVEVTITQEESK